MHAMNINFLAVQQESIFKHSVYPLLLGYEADVLSETLGSCISFLSSVAYFDASGNSNGKHGDLIKNLITEKSQQ